MATKSNGTVNTHGLLSDLGRVAIDVPAAQHGLGEYIGSLSKTAAELLEDAAETAIAGAREVEAFETGQAEDMAAEERATREQIAREQSETREIAAKLRSVGVTLGTKTTNEAVREIASL